MKGLSFFRRPEVSEPSLLIGWSADAGRLGLRVIDYLNRNLGGKKCGEIKPEPFFQLGGVTIEDDLVQFPEASFYTYPGHDLLGFRSDPPSHEWSRFITLLLDAAEQYHVRDIYTIGGMISLSAHTSPPQLLGTFTMPETREALGQYDLNVDLDYETPPGQRPTLSSYVLWAARQRGIPGVSLWVPMPFYLLAVGDPRAQRRVLEFLNQRFGLGLDLGDLDTAVRRQNQLIADVRQDLPDVDQSLQRLETNLGLSAEESQGLARDIEHFLRRNR